MTHQLESALERDLWRRGRQAARGNERNDALDIARWKAANFLRQYDSLTVPVCGY